jgi:hypothetical protein
MIGALHVATGAATGELTRSRPAAVALGPILHLASDRVPHRHPRWAVDCLVGVGALAYVVYRRGITDVTTLGALAAIAPDLKHLRRTPRRRRPWWRRGKPHGLQVRVQLALAVVLLAPLARAGSRR